MMQSIVDLRSQIRLIETSMSQVITRLELLDNVLIPLSVPETSGRYRNERVVLYRTYQDIVNQWKSLQRELDLWSRV